MNLLFGEEAMLGNAPKPSTLLAMLCDLSETAEPAGWVAEAVSVECEMRRHGHGCVGQHAEN
jgi:hypothetical protein